MTLKDLRARTRPLNRQPATTESKDVLKLVLSMVLVITTIIMLARLTH